MALTILQMINQAQAELGLPLDSVVYNANATETAIQMGALANRVLDELRRDHRWVTLQTEYNLVVGVGISTTGDMVAESAVITNIPSTAGIEAWSWVVSGNGIPQASRVLTVDSATQVTLSMENVNTEDVVGAELIFAQDTYPMPSDFDWYINRTMWDRTNYWELIGPDSPQVDQWHRSGIVTTGPRRHYRQIGPKADKFRIWPPPFDTSTPLQLVFEYLSNAPVNVEASATNFAQYFENDTDTTVMDDNALIMGIKWMFWEIKGFGSYVTLQGRWIDYVNRLKSRDGAAPTLRLAQCDDSYLLTTNQVQDGFFPGPDN